MRKMTMGALGVALLIGLLLGPGYWAYATFLSGEKVGDFLLMTREVDHTAVGGFSSTSSGSAEMTPAELELSPEMNPVAFTVTARAVPPTGAGLRSRSALFRLRVTESGKEIWNKEFDISYQKKKEDKDKVSIGSLGAAQFPRISERLDLFRVPSPGSYRVQLETVNRQGGSGPDLVVSEMRMSVRRNVQPPNVTLVLIGVGISLAAFAGLWILKDKG